MFYHLHLLIIMVIIFIQFLLVDQLFLELKNTHFSLVEKEVVIIGLLKLMEKILIQKNICQ